MKKTTRDWSKPMEVVIAPLAKAPPQKQVANCAFATIHFGSNPVYLELEMYFFRMLRKYTSYDIIYLYSVNDTPGAFVDAVRPLVTHAIPYDDRGITFDVTFASSYANFNTLRTCNFIFAYTLEQYETVCIIESDMVIMKSVDDIFELNAPAALTYYIGDARLNYNDQVSNSPSKVLIKCKEMGRLNGGVMLIKPSAALFNTYLSAIKKVVERNCKYPNETLFEYVNNVYYNLPIRYNLSHFLAKPEIIAKYGLAASDVRIFHFNETKFKHIDIIKNPVDENNYNWFEAIKTEPKYSVKRLPVVHYYSTVYEIHRPEIEGTMIQFSKKNAPQKPASPIEEFLKELTPPKLKPVSPIEEFLKPTSPLEEMPMKPISPKEEKELLELEESLREMTLLNPKEEIEKIVKASSSSSSSSENTRKKNKTGKPKKSKCPKGTRRNKKTGKCDPFEKKVKANI
jgi:hypothetical protein